MSHLVLLPLGTRECDTYLMSFSLGVIRLFGNLLAFWYRFWYDSGMVTDKDTKARENRLRRAAERQGLTLEKCRYRDHRALGYGTYRLVQNGYVIAFDAASGYGLNLDEIEACLNEEDS